MSPATPVWEHLVTETATGGGPSGLTLFLVGVADREFNINLGPGARAVTWWSKLLACETHFRRELELQLLCFPTTFLLMCPGKLRMMAQQLLPLPAAGVPGCCLWPGPALAVVVIGD